MALASAGISARWQGSRPAERACVSLIPTAYPADAAPRAPWADALPREIVGSGVWGNAHVADRCIDALWDSTAPPADIAPARSSWGISQIADQSRHVVSGLPLLVAIETHLRAVWGVSQIADLARLLPGSGGLVLVAAHVSRRAIWGLAETADRRTWSPWGMGRLADSGASVIVEPGNPDDPDSPLIIPTLRAYIVINSAALSRVSNNLSLPVTNLSISIDSDSAHWTWSATLPLRSLADLEPDAPGELVELEAVVNGLPWRLAVERIRESERFGAGSLSIGGRGIAAELSDPAYPVVPHDNVTAAATAQQLADTALSINGVSLGWALTWQAADWLVPAGAWVHSGTPLDAVVRIAAAAGAYVQAAPAARLLRVLPRYPVAPWEWTNAVPSIVLPATAVLERGSEHVTRATYDSVYVSGQAQGILAHVKRTGTAGSRPAQMIVDQLITHADAARGRGLEVLGNTGAQQIVTLETGVLPASGVIHVGSLMDWERGAVSRRGLVRSLVVSATVPTGASKEPVKVRQTIGVEIHG